MAEVEIDEEWRPILGIANDRFEASSLGRIRNARSKRIRSARLSGWGDRYFRVFLEKHFYRVHRLVCTAFHGQAPAELPNALHKDDNSTNNVPENLYWGTKKDNAEDRCRNGNQVKNLGEKNGGGGKLISSNIPLIRSDTRIQSKIAADYGISQVMVSRIKLGKSWSHIQ